jgi:hypothetical protein
MLCITDREDGGVRSVVINTSARMEIGLTRALPLSYHPYCDCSGFQCPATWFQMYPHMTIR